MEHEKVLEEKAIQAKAMQDKAMREKAMEEKAIQEKAVQEKALLEKSRQQKIMQEEAMQENVMQQKAVQQKSMEETALQEKAANTQWCEESTKLLVKKDFVQQPSVKEEIVETAKEDRKVETPTIIDLDTDTDTGDTDTEGSSPDMSMALVVVPQPEESPNHNTDLAIVRADNSEACEATSQSNGVHDGQLVNNSPTPENELSVARQCPQGNGNVQAARAGEWLGPPRWASTTVGILSVQCARCLKWRVVPSREKYEEIREHILETPWVCESAREWRPDANCDLPTDLNQDSESLWAIDKPNLPSSPHGWSRKVVVRRDCSTRFADVYYIAPEGKTLRSSVEVAKYLEDNPGSVPPGTTLSQFSFTSPRPLPGVWVARKRNKTKALEGHPNSQENKKAKTAQPLAKQLAQKLLHGTAPPSLPVAPSFPFSAAPSCPMGAPSLGPDLVQFVAMQANPNSTLFTSALPLRQCPPPSGCVNNFTRPSQQASVFPPQGMTWDHIRLREHIILL
ncbi:unnamed protein product [Calypogeia fissa]